MTADQYIALGETPERYELVDGVVIMSPSPTFRHQKLVMLLIRQLDRYVEPRGGELVADIDIVLTPKIVYRPDIVYFRPGRLVGTPERLSEPPDLIVEIISPSSKSLDLITKRNDYEKFGVGEYWVVDPETLQVRRWVRRGQRFEEAAVEADSMSCDAIPGFVLDLRPMRALILA